MRRAGESIEAFRIRDAAWQRARRADPVRGPLIREWQRVRRITHNVIITAQQRASWARTGQRFKKYGITREVFDEYLDAQEGACAYCGKELPKDESRMAIDHDHVTGLVRGITHLNCNMHIGLAEEHFLGYMAASA